VSDQSLSRDEGHPAVDAVAGLLAAAAIAVAVVGIAYRPARLTPAAILLSLIAAAMSTRWRTLAAVAAVVAGLAWLVGMSIAVLTDGPIF
jgi:hypothetical protein